jgi:uncharacterized protein (TIGR02145 family)
MSFSNKTIFGRACGASSKLGVAFIILLLPIMSCDFFNGSSALVGHWLHESGSTSKVPQDMELFKDGTGVCDGGSISWKVENKRLIIQSSSLGMARDYEVSGARLTLTDNGDKVTYLDINNKNYQKSLQKSTFTDSRDGKKYGTIKIGTQTWMSENLNYEANGKCYENDPANCQKYGKLYDWNTALNACPKGWHLPNNDEWQTLVAFAGDKVAGKKLKSRSGWDKSGNGTDIFGFSALPGGYGSSGGSFYGGGIYGYWWVSSESNASNAYSRGINYNYESTSRLNSGKSLLFSVRCVQD